MKKYKYTLLVAFEGAYMQTVQDGDNSFEAIGALLDHMKAFGDHKRTIISITVTEVKEVKR